MPTMGPRRSFKLAGSQNSQVSTALNRVSPQPVTGAMMHLSGWLTPTGMWSVDPLDRVADTGLTPKPPIDVGAYAPNRGLRRTENPRVGGSIPPLATNPTCVASHYAGDTPALVFATSRSYGVWPSKAPCGRW